MKSQARFFADISVNSQLAKLSLYFVTGDLSVCPSASLTHLGVISPNLQLLILGG